jgi:hypothetical protein
MPRRTPTRLELHRLRYHKENHRLPLLPMSSLDTIEKLLISKDFFSRLFFERRLSHPYEVYGEVLSSWGIMCPHPQLGKDSVCGCCGSRVLGARLQPASQRAMRA